MFRSAPSGGTFGGGTFGGKPFAIVLRIYLRGAEIDQVTKSNARGFGMKRVLTLVGTLIFVATGFVVASAPASAASGATRISISGNDFSAEAVGQQADGRLLVAGEVDALAKARGHSCEGMRSKVALVRMSAAGTKDASFGGGKGYVTAPAPAQTRLSDIKSVGVIVLGDGKIALFALKTTYSVCDAEEDEVVSSQDLVVYRYLESGALDTSFGGGDGVVTTSSTAFGLKEFDVAEVAPDGSWVAAGSAAPKSDYVVARVAIDGTMLTAFGGDGFVALPNASVGNFGAGGAFVSQAGEVTLGGNEFDSGSDDIWGSDGSFVVSKNMMSVRMLASGALDTSYGGGDGIASTAMSKFTPEFISMTPAPDASGVMRSLVWGLWIDTSDVGPIVEGGGFGALDAAGDFDKSFAGGTGMQVAVDFANNDSLLSVGGFDLNVMSSNSILIAGAGLTDYSQGFDWGKIRVGRFSQLGVPDTSFGTKGVATTLAPLPNATGVVDMIEVVGGSSVVVVNDGTVLRYGDAGVLDSSFGKADLCWNIFGKQRALPRKMIATGLVCNAQNTGVNIKLTRGADQFAGGSGADSICGRGGNDTLRGGRGSDLICGGAGEDVLNGEAGNDRLIGGRGGDSFYDTFGRDIAIGGAGNDVFNLADEKRRDRRRGRADTIECGPGADHVTADKFDRVDDDCETVDRV